jgi:quinoprotein glucose dehydrogenase
MDLLARLSKWLLALVLAAVGGLLAWVGAQLAGLGGSLYYLLAGVVLLVCALLVARGSRHATSLYGLFFVATLGWASWESGLDGWALAPRLALFAALGLWLLAPLTRRALGQPGSWPGSRVFWPAFGLGIPVAVLAVFWLDQPAGGTAAVDAAYRPASVREGEWLHWGNDARGQRYSPLKQITPDNVGRLKPAWTYHIGMGPLPERFNLQATPLKVGDRLYLCAGYGDVVSLDAETGREVWRFAAKVDVRGVALQNCRGVTYYRLPGATGACAERVYGPTVDARLLALDAATGEPCAGFGNGGAVDLLQGMGVVDKGYYYVTSPPALVRGRLVLGGWVMDGQHTNEPSGVIRAFDAVTGAFVWAFDMGRPGEHGLPPDGQSFTRNTPNSWAPMSADEELGLVYAPTGNSTPDYVGEHRRPFDEQYSSSVVALDADSGAVRWSFQTTRHDLWDYDVPAQPTLVDLADGRKAVFVPTKRGETFVLDRVTGKPIAAVTDKPVSQSGIAPGEWFAKTQPFSTGFPSFPGLEPSEARMWGITPIDQALCRIEFRKARFEGTMTPIGLDRPTIVWPGYVGGSDWGGVTVDPERQVLFMNTSGVGNYNQLLTRAQADRLGLKPVSATHQADLAYAVPQAGTQYAAAIRPWLSALGIPCQQPPYGVMAAVDLKTSTVIWQRRLGTARDDGPWGLRAWLPLPMGMPNTGGSVVTAGGLVFIGATTERMFRAYDAATGRKVWQARLPAGGHATPMTYWSEKSGRQFVAIASSGHPVYRSGRSDTLTAYALEP